MKFRRSLFLSGLISLAAVVWFGFWIASRYEIPVILYHDIAEGTIVDHHVVSPEVFRRQLDFLSRQGYHVISLTELVKIKKAGGRMPRRTVAMTFDDGMENNFSKAFPLLKFYKMPAAFFVSAGLIGKPSYMSWEQILLMYEDGMEIASHGMTHAYLPDLTPEQKKFEIQESKKILEAQLKTKVGFYAYPLGGFDDAVQALVREAGYEAAFTTNRGRKWIVDNRYAIKRIKLTNTDQSQLVLWLKLSGYYNIFRDHKASH